MAEVVNATNTTNTTEIPMNTTQISIPGLDLPDLTGCAETVIGCFSNVTSLLLPSACGLPPASLMAGGPLNETALNQETVKWAQCACPTLVPAAACLTEGVASCPALNETLAQFKPSIETGCALLGVTNSSTNGTTNSTDGKASMGFSVQGSFVSVLALALLL